jgi:hypothetical protein
MDAVEVRASFDRLLEEFGASLGLSDIKAGEDGACHIAFEPDTELSMLPDPVDGDLVVWTSPGALGADKEAACRKLLEANLFWRGTGGATLSLLPGSDEIVLATRRPLAGLDVEGFKALIEQMVLQSERLQHELAGNGDARPKNDTAADWSAQMLRG